MEFFCYILSAQDYHAVQGSSLAGSLGVSDNPASIVNTPFAWDVNIFSLQCKSASNLYTIVDYSFVSSPNKLKYYFNPGDYKRFTDVNFNLHLVNARIALDRKQAISFGMNLVGYGRLKTEPYNYVDTIHNAYDFFSINTQNNVLSGNFTASSWLEIFGTYSRTIYDDGNHRLNTGVTLRAMRGVAGAFAEMQGATFTSSVNNANETVYKLNSANARYGYSYNIDDWKKNNSFSENLDNFLNNTRGRFSGDIGFEYLVKPVTLSDYYNPSESYYDYDWKIGVALLDVGYNKYKYGTEGKIISDPKNVLNTTLDKKFNKVRSLSAANNSVASIVYNISPLEGIFKIYNPTRIIINADRFLNNNFYINAELSFNLLRQFGGISNFYTQSLNLLTVTPRWETLKWGVYFPMQYNTEHQFWIGGAIKAGPLLLGVHNWANIFTKKNVQNGGGYIAVVIRSKKNTKVRIDKRLDCPKY